jgi:ankyrin repeat protein
MFPVRINKTVSISPFQAGQVEMVDMLLTYRSDPNVAMRKGNRITPVHAATKQGHIGVLEVLLQGRTHNIGVDEKDGKGFTPLMTACTINRPDIVEILLANGADVNLVNNAGFTPLHIACEQVNADIVQMLLEAGANLKQETTQGTPLDIAKKSKDKSVIDALKKGEGEGCRIM